MSFTQGSAGSSAGGSFYALADQDTAEELVHVGEGAPLLSPSAQASRIAKLSEYFRGYHFELIRNRPIEAKLMQPRTVYVDIQEDRTGFYFCYSVKREISKKGGPYEYNGRISMGGIDSRLGQLNRRPDLEELREYARRILSAMTAKGHVLPQWQVAGVGLWAFTNMIAVVRNAMTPADGLWEFWKSPYALIPGGVVGYFAGLSPLKQMQENSTPQGVYNIGVTLAGGATDKIATPLHWIHRGLGLVLGALNGAAIGKQVQEAINAFMTGIAENCVKWTKDGVPSIYAHASSDLAAVGGALAFPIQSLLYISRVLEFPLPWKVGSATGKYLRARPFLMSANMLLALTAGTANYAFGKKAARENLYAPEWLAIALGLLSAAPSWCLNFLDTAKLVDLLWMRENATFGDVLLSFLEAAPAAAAGAFVAIVSNELDALGWFFITMAVLYNWLPKTFKMLEARDKMKATPDLLGPDEFFSEKTRWDCDEIPLLEAGVYIGVIGDLPIARGPMTSDETLRDIKHPSGSVGSSPVRGSGLFSSESPFRDGTGASEEDRRPSNASTSGGGWRLVPYAETQTAQTL